MTLAGLQSLEAINDIYVDGEQYEELRQSIEESVWGSTLRLVAPCSFLREFWEDDGI